MSMRFDNVTIQAHCFVKATSVSSTAWFWLFILALQMIECTVWSNGQEQRPALVSHGDELVSGIVLRNLAARSGDTAINSSPNPRKPPILGMSSKVRKMP